MRRFGRAGTPRGLAVAALVAAGRALAAGCSKATFELSVSRARSRGSGCHTVASLEVTPPGGGGALNVPDGFQACGRSIGVSAVTATS